MKNIKTLLIIIVCLILPGCGWFLGTAETYIVTYDDNGGAVGTVPVDSNEYEAGDTVTVLGNTGDLGIDGGLFIMWNTKADGTGSGYAAGAELVMGASNLILYAEWSGQWATVSNFADGSALFSNIVLGTALSEDGDIAAIECSIDGGEFADAQGTASWSFTVPSGTAAFKIGTSHTIAVRVTDGEDRATVSEFTFIRGKYRDFNGDGFRDLFVGAPNTGSQNSRVYIFLGTADGIPDSDVTADGADITFTPSSASVLLLGYGLAVGDFNGDGFADIAATENKHSTDTGAVYVVHGGPTWADQNDVISVVANTIITGKQTYDYLGYYAGCGDLDSDGIDDLFASAHFYGDTPVVRGRTYVFYGSVSGIADVDLSSGSADFTITGENLYDQFGASPLTGDFNGDGSEDLFISAVGYYGGSQPSLYKGRGYIFHGSGARFDSIDLSLPNTADTILTGTADGDKFCIGHAADLDRDGYDDLMVRELGVDANRGIVHFFYGSNDSVELVSCGEGPK